MKGYALVKLVDFASRDAKENFSGGALTHWICGDLYLPTYLPTVFGCDQ